MRQQHKQQISNLLLQHSQTTRPLPGIAASAARETLAMQIIASIRREDYFRAIQDRGPINADRANPHSGSFEAELGVAHHLQHDNYDEAAWLTFLMVYLAKPTEGGWRRLRDIYGRLGNGLWDWTAVSADPEGFEQWLAGNWQSIRSKFGNHRKYQSLRPTALRPMGPSVVTYVQWVNAAGGHKALFSQMVRAAGNDPHTIFDAFYRNLPVPGFGRLGRFDWASMLSRYRLIPAEAGSAYLNNATGPKAGMRLLFSGNAKAKTQPAILQQWLDELDANLRVGMEVLEDAICNWQKKPTVFEHFKG